MRIHFRTIRKARRGQSFVEMALLFPVLLILISGMIEFGLMLNQFLAIVDAARNAARFSSDGIFTNRDGNMNCDPGAGTVTSDFYFQTACIALSELRQERPTITVDLAEGDDILVSAYSVSGWGSPSVTGVYPATGGWSYAQAVTGTRNQSSNFSAAEVASRLQTGAPNTGLVIVEIYYHYDQALGLPWITAFIPNPVLLHAYTFMPLVSAEPTSTPPPP
jgi:hypothetical protein